MLKRVNAGWRLAKDSFKVLKADRSLAVFPALSTLFAVVTIALTLTPGLMWSDATDKDWIVLPFMAVGAYVTTFFVVYFNVALAGAARLSMDGHDSTVADGLAVARERRGLIVKWATLQFLVGVVVNTIGYIVGDSIAGRLVALVTSLVSVAWTVSTFFVIPLLALEGLSPGDAFKRSASLVRQRWGEGLVGTAAIGLAVFVAAGIPALVLLNAAVQIQDEYLVLGTVLFALSIVALIGACALGSALGVIFRVELYRYSLGSQATGDFAEQDVAAAFGPAPAPASS